MKTIPLFFILIYCATVYGREVQPVSADTSSYQKCKYYPDSTGGERLFCKPKLFEFFRKMPGDYSAFAKREFRCDQVKKYAIVTASTLVLIWADQVILDDVQKFGRTIHLSNADRMKTIAEAHVKYNNQVFNFPIQIPDNLNSSFYFLGDGVFHTTLAAGFWGVGKITKDYRAEQTGSQILEQMFVGGVVTQFLKHITGRESPFTTNVPRGVWRFFPNQEEYAKHVPNHDAFPSGHLTTAIGTVTVIAENYPELHLIRPIGYSLCGLLAFAMLNNGVHWASDYPLAIVLGYSFGKIATRTLSTPGKEKTTSYSPKKSFVKKPDVYPSVISKTMGIALAWKY